MTTTETIDEAQADDTPEESDTELEFRELHAETVEQISRVRAMADKASVEHPEVAAVFREMSETVLSLMRDLVASSGGALRALEDRSDELTDRVEDLEQGALPAESFLMPNDAADFLAYLEQVQRVLTELIALADQNNMSSQKEAFEALLRMTEDRIAFTQSISGDAEEPEAEAEDGAEPEEGSGVGQA